LTDDVVGSSKPIALRVALAVDVDASIASASTETLPSG
jgi:hypothetical protein